MAYTVIRSESETEARSRLAQVQPEYERMKRAPNKQLWTPEQWERFHYLQFKADFYEEELRWLRKQREKPDRLNDERRKRKENSGWSTAGR